MFDSSKTKMIYFLAKSLDFIGLDTFYVPGGGKWKDRVFEVKDEECVACNLCVSTCPVEDCITMEQVYPGQRDIRTGRVVPEVHGDWTTHPNNPSKVAAE